MPRTAVLLIAHGSRHAPANEDLILRWRAGWPIGPITRSSSRRSSNWPSPTSPIPAAGASIEGRPGS